MSRSVLASLVVGALLCVAIWAVARSTKSPSVPVSSTEERPQPDAREVPPCRITGCSGQVCSDEEVITTCEYRPEYACYKTAVCEPARDGVCGWRMDEELKDCLARMQ